MMARQKGRTQDCTPAQARKRQADAQSFLDVAHLAADETDPDVEYRSVAASLAVLAGIAASDAACCHALGKRSRSQDHRDAEELLTEITPGGKGAAKNLDQLLSLKDSAHYGLISVSTAQLTRARRQAKHLVDFAEGVIRR
ncbi:MAG: hypothetical protein EXQ70_11965 [Solirubrobacterales bacterium]|nr:hypothetical protein [Solirubrobacterales bacterium]